MTGFASLGRSVQFEPRPAACPGVHDETLPHEGKDRSLLFHVRTQVLLDEDYRRDSRHVRLGGRTTGDGRKGPGICGAGWGDLPMKRPDIAVVGGGLLGRCLAWCVPYWDTCRTHMTLRATREKGSAAWVAAGMIAPTVESIEVASQVQEMGGTALRCGRNGWPSCPSQFSIVTVELCCCGTFRSGLKADWEGVEPRRPALSGPLSARDFGRRVK